ncbi:MAG: hypothetical protein K8H87_06440 [Pseudorhodoplanes sp.]|nr:hypothetical protein [Pseudorhodoplanes sp.]
MAAGFAITIVSVPAIVSECETLLSLGGTPVSGLALVFAASAVLGAVVDAIGDR